MTTIRRINVSQINGDSANENNAGEIRPFGEVAFYQDESGPTEKLTLMIFDGQRTHLKSKILAPGRFYGSDADAGDGSGSDTIKLIPDATLHYNGSDQYIVVDPTGGEPGHIHLRAGGTQDASSADLYLGGELTFVRVSDTSDTVTIRTTQAGDPAISKQWQFTPNGDLYFPSTTADLFIGEDEPGLTLKSSLGIAFVTNLDANSQAWIFDSDGNLTVPGTIIFSGSPAVLTLSTLTTTDVNASGNISANYFIGNGSQLTGLPASYTNSNVTTLLANLGTNNISTTGNITAGNILTNNYYYANGSPFTPGSVYGDSNVVNLLSSFGSNSVSTSGNLTGGNLNASGNIKFSANSGNIVFNNGASIHTDTGALNRNGSIVLTPYTGAGSTFPGVVIGGAGRLLSPQGSVHQVFNTSDVTFQVQLKSSISTAATSTSTGALVIPGGVGVGGNLYVGGDSSTGINAIVAGLTNTLLPNTAASFTTNVNNYSQVTFQNKNTGADATADFILTADNGSDSTNYGDFGIINSGYDNATPTNSLGNIVYAADTYIYAQGNLSNTSQSGGNLVIGTTTSAKTVKIFAGGATNNNLVANISNTGVAVTGTVSATGNVTAANFIGNISITGNVTGTSSNVDLVAGAYTWSFNNTGNLVLPGNTFAVNYANGTAVSLGGAGTSYTDANVTTLLASLGSNVISSTANITTTANISGGNLITTGTFQSANISATGNITSGNGFNLVLGNAASALRQAGSNANVQLAGSINLIPDTAASSLNGVLIGGNGYLLGPSGSRVLTLNYNGVSGALGVQSNLVVGTASGGTANITGTATTGVNTVLAGVTNTILSNTVAAFSANVNNYTQITFQNKNTGADATADYILTADNGNDTTNYGDFGIINSGYDNATPTNSLGNIVFAADTYLYAQGNSSATSQSGGNLVIGTATANKSVKIFAGGNTNNSLVANISNVGINVTGSLTVSGNITGSTPNVNLVAGSYTTTFDNTGNVTIPGNVVVNGSLGIRTPNLPAFRIYGAGSSNWTTANTNFKGSGIVVDYNQGNHFNSNTGVFTTPIAGLYNITLNARVGNNNGSNQIMVIKNGLTTAGNVAVMWECDTNTGTATHFGVSTVMKLAVGDTLTANITLGNVQFDANDSWTVTYLG